jgi:hypothetical protein
MKSPLEILARIERLVARASSPEKEEARTAAELAVSLMRQYGVRLSLGEDHIIASAAPEAKLEPPPAKPQNPPSRAQNPPPKASKTPPPRPEHIAPTTVTRIIYRCAGCGRVVGKPGLCAGCIEARSEVGIWNVVCDGCGRQAPGGRSFDKAHDAATFLGYVVTDDDRTLCPECLSREVPWQRAVR